MDVSTAVLAKTYLVPNPIPSVHIMECVRGSDYAKARAAFMKWKAEEVAGVPRAACTAKVEAARKRRTSKTRARSAARAKKRHLCELEGIVSENDELCKILAQGTGVL